MGHRSFQLVNGTRFSLSNAHGRDAALQNSSFRRATAIRVTHRPFQSERKVERSSTCCDSFVKKRGKRFVIPSNARENRKGERKRDVGEMGVEGMLGSFNTARLLTSLFICRAPDVALNAGMVQKMSRTDFRFISSL